MGELAGLVAGSGFASGLSLYATVLLLGLAGRYLDAGLVPEQLTATPVLVAAGVLTVVEFVADKVPWLDSTWDTIHTVVRPVGAAWVGAIIVNQPDLVDAAGIAAGDPVTAAVVSGLLAGIAHGAKATTRVAVNSSPEPFSNPIVSLLEDGVVVGLVWLAIEHPAIAVAVVVVLAVLALIVTVLLWRMARRVIRGRRRRRATAP